MDVALLKALTHKAQFNSLRHAVPTGMVSPNTVALLAWYAAYFTAFPTREVLDVDELQTLVKLRSTTAPAEQVAITLHLIEGLRVPLDEEGRHGILAQLTELDLSGKVGALTERYQAGEEIDYAFELKTLADASTKALAATQKSDFVRGDIGEILAQLGRDDGLKFNFIHALRTGVRGLIPGDSALFAARVDSGKTSFLCQMAACFAPQVQRFFGPDRPILFMVNESDGARMLPRLRQAALKLTVPEMIAAHHAGTLERDYEAALGGTRIEVKNIHGWSLAQVERFVQQVRPSVFITDMPANIRMHLGNGSKTDALEQAFQHLRDLAVGEQSISFGTAQISVEGADQLYPPLTALKDTKTGVQGALDLQINLGSLNNPAAGTLRGISTPKNKLSINGQPSCMQSEVYFDKDRCQFTDGGQHVRLP